MIKIFRLCTKNNGDSFAFFSRPGDYDVLRKCQSSSCSKRCDVSVQIETEDEQGVCYRSVDLLGLTNDTFIARDNVIGKYSTILNHDGEWMKIESPSGFFLYNVVSVIDIVNEDLSTLEYFTDSGKIMSIDKYVFRYSPLVRTSLLFRSSLDPYREILCTELFVKSYRSILGSGLEFFELGTMSV